PPDGFHACPALRELQGREEVRRRRQAPAGEGYGRPGEGGVRAGLLRRLEEGRGEAQLCPDEGRMEGNVWVIRRAVDGQTPVHPAAWFLPSDWAVMLLVSPP